MTNDKEAYMETLYVLLVDDEPRYLETTSRLLSRKGCSVATAGSGVEALALLAKEPAHVVVLDVKMPGMDGHETFRAIRKSYPLVEVILLTGHGTVDSAVEGLKAGAFDYLVKPADIDLLWEKVNDAWQAHRRHGEKIRLAMLERSMQTPREIMKQQGPKIDA